MNADDCDAYRARYGGMSYGDIVDAHSVMYEGHPVQKHYDRERLLAFFGGITERVSVVELGGWDGEVAAMILSAKPNIERWVNHEICREAASASVCLDSRYEVFSGKFIWECDLSEFNVFVASHSVEHITAEQWKLLAPKVMGKRCYIDMPPFPKGKSRWDGTTCLHVNNMTEEEVIESLR